jgi:hypothetical protein
MSEQSDHPGYELAYQEALRGITQQQAVLGSLHSRAGTLLAVASIVTSFLASIVLADGDPSGLAWLAILFFPRDSRPGRVRAGAEGPVALPQPAQRHHRRLRRGRPSGAPPWAMYKQLAEHLETDYTANQENMTPLFRALQLANLALAAEVVLWLVILIRR